MDFFLSFTNFLTVLPSRSLLKCICLAKRQPFLYLSVFTLVFVLVGCSSPKHSAKKPIKIEAPTKIVQSTVVRRSGQDTLNQAQRLSKQNLNNQVTDNKQAALINQLLIEASELFLQEKKFLKALWLANKVSQMVSTTTNVYRLLLVKAASLQALNHTEQATAQLHLIAQLASDTKYQQSASKVTLTLTYYQLLSDVLLAQNKLSQSLAAQLFAFSLHKTTTEQDIFGLWQQLIQLPPWQIQQIANEKPPFFKGWQQLLSYSQKFGDKPLKLSRYLSLWEKKYPTHPAHIIVETLLNSEITSEHIENIAVLLPLTGAQSSAGLAAQQGILAAYQNPPSVNIHFIDTNHIDWDTLAVKFSELTIDHVIGPLLRPHVDKYITISANAPNLQVPTLLLNKANQPLASYQSVLSMRPENEAEQAAEVLSQQSYQSPLILSYQDKTSKRIAQAFSHKWQKITGKPVDIVYFDQGKKMQSSLKDSLDVNASQIRIDQLKGRLKQVIKAEPRNRRDLDMIYLVGTAAQTRLIKPYIDVNISPFATVIPVYASSRSHSYFNDINNEDSTSDLQNLTFTQMPWLLNAKQRNKPLAKLSQELWPKRTDSLSRIFAMGFDSYQLLEKIPLMQQAPYIVHYGQTGTLKLEENNIITRSLTWGRYQKNKAMEVSID